MLQNWISHCSFITRLKDYELPYAKGSGCNILLKLTSSVNVFNNDTSIKLLPSSTRPGPIVNQFGLKLNSGKIQYWKTIPKNTQVFQAYTSWIPYSVNMPVVMEWRMVEKGMRRQQSSSSWTRQIEKLD